MKRMTYKTLMKKIDEGYAEVWAWSNESGETAVADVIFYTSNGNSRRQHVEITRIPAEFQI